MELDETFCRSVKEVPCPAVSSPSYRFITVIPIALADLADDRHPFVLRRPAFACAKPISALVANAVLHGPVTEQGQKQECRKRNSRETEDGELPLTQHTQGVGCACNESPFAKYLVDEQITQEQRLFALP